MRLKAIVVYASKYGSTEKYARWIAEALECPVKKLQELRNLDLGEYDTILYGGGLYAGGIAGFKKFVSRLESTKEKKLVLFMVGMTNPAEKEVYANVAERNIPEKWKGRFEIFALRGDQLFSKMNGLHRLMMRVPKSMTEKKPVSERSEDDKHFLEHFGQDIIYTSKEQINPILSLLRS